MKKTFVAFFLIALGHLAYSQPMPIDLGIQNIPQQDNMWCWAAVAQQIILWKTGAAPDQCEMVARAKNANIQVCCNFYTNCSTPGNFVDIQNLLLIYGAGYSALAAPTNPTMLYNTLASNKPVILFLNQPYQNIGHFVVLTGMGWVNDPIYGLIPFVHINDPMSIYTQPMPFANIIGLWQAAIIVN